MSTRGRVRVRVRCGADELAECAGVLRLYRRGRRVGARKFVIDPGESKRVGVRLSRSTRRLVRRRGRLRLKGVARARDASGNLARVVARFTVRAPR
jgi:hypothetical protein